MPPHVNPRKEYESPINDYRVAAGLTHKELAAKANVYLATISGLANGMISPVKEDGSGQLRLGAKKLCDFFGVEPEELFPRYFCSVNLSYTFEMQPYETWSERMAENCWEQVENREMANLLLKIGMADATPRERRVLKWYLFDDVSFTEMAEREGVTAPRIAVAFRQSINRMADAAQKIGLPIDPAHWRTNVQQVFE